MRFAPSVGSIGPTLSSRSPTLAERLRVHPYLPPSPYPQVYFVRDIYNDAVHLCTAEPISEVDFVFILPTTSGFAYLSGMVGAP